MVVAKPELVMPGAPVSSIRRHGTGGIEIVSMDKWSELKRRIHDFNPKTDMGRIVASCFKWLPPDLAQELLDTVTRCVIITTQLELKVFRTPDSPYRHGGPLVLDLGVVSRRKVTTQGVVALCVAWGSAAFNMIYMGMGTASGAEANTDTVASFVEIAAANYAGGVRPTCTHVESSNTVPLVATHTQTTAGNTIEEHGIMDSATQEAGNLWDRSLTGTQTLAVGDGLQGTYTLTASAEA